MSDNNLPSFTEALDALSKALNINFTTLFEDLFEDVELARQAFIKRVKEEKSDVENSEVGVQSRKFNCVDFWPAMDSNPDDLDAALHKLGVDKPDEEEVEDEDFSVEDDADQYVIQEAQRRVIDAQQRVQDAQKDLADARAGAEDTIARLRADLSMKPADTWSNTSFHIADIDDAFKKFQRLQAQKGAQFVPRDVSAKPAVETWEILIRDTQDTVEVETDHVEIDGDFDAWRNDTHVLHVPAGEYLYAKKVSA
ncbi:hypothetical protein QNA24_29715 [Rhodococcus qingshengii]|uniref:hypothetical protein n=1 Tax=Rhodococcus TaxID=1827 RepID=UPI001E57B5C3|nr:MULTISPECIES: hypothetical protein [Rhodococcus]MCD2099553.1 hypothetical protein [Rhodococcus rhodochrous]MCD2123921.1 hypothetical protein [Rhodococcus rhodochrous]MCQ4136651.1 hypothetical protein [Rhodococcus rhodochrous]MDJ0490562.1 hypothetical protein [Rhodococcus qingshengii]